MTEVSIKYGVRKPVITTLLTAICHGKIPKLKTLTIYFSKTEDRNTYLEIDSTLLSRTAVKMEKFCITGKIGSYKLNELFYTIIKTANISLKQLEIRSDLYSFKYVSSTLLKKALREWFIYVLIEISSITYYIISNFINITCKGEKLLTFPYFYQLKFN